MFSSLLAISPLDGRYADRLAQLRPLFSEFGLIKFRLKIEVEWLLFLLNKKIITETSISNTANQYLKNMIADFSEQDAERIKQIEAETNHDLKSVEYFIKEKMQAFDELKKFSEFIHFGCTSEDINNLAHALILKTAREEMLLPTIDKLISSITDLAHKHADQAMLARTHGQPATPTTLGKEFANVAARLIRQRDNLSQTDILGKLAGATGNYNAFTVAFPETDWQALSSEFISNLGLSWNAYTTQIEPHDYIAEIFMNVMRINTILLDFNRDMWSYISIEYFTQQSINKEVGSSAMPHKINPIDFENSEGNLGLANALLDHMANKLPISRWQRDLSDSTVLRNIGVALSYSYLAYTATMKGLQKLTPNQAALEKDLMDHWEVLAEPIQTVMRKHGIDQPYELLKAFTRGKKIDKAILHDFIQKLDLPTDAKQTLLALTPLNYLGYAKKLAAKI